MWALYYYKCLAIKWCRQILIRNNTSGNIAVSVYISQIFRQVRCSLRWTHDWPHQTLLNATNRSKIAILPSAAWENRKYKHIVQLFKCQLHLNTLQWNIYLRSPIAFERKAKLLKSTATSHLLVWNMTYFFLFELGRYLAFHWMVCQMAKSKYIEEYFLA